MKGKLSSFAIAAALLILLASCKGTETSSTSSEQQSENSIGTTTSVSSSVSSSSSDANNSVGTAVTDSETGSVINNSTSTASIGSVSSSGNSDSSSVSTVTDSALTLALQQYHPGVPGFDVTYTLVTKYNNSLVNAGDVSYACSDSRVTISSNQVIVPQSVRDDQDAITVIATYKTQEQASVSIPLKKWETSFNDDFDGTSLDYNNWSVYEPGVAYSATVSITSADCCEVNDGILSLIADKKETVVNGTTYEYSSASISTKDSFKQQYGCFMVKMKIPSQGGLNSAFWLLPTGAYSSSYAFFQKNNPSIGCGEVDITEMSANWNGKYYITEHYFNFANGNVHTSRYFNPTVNGDPASDYHVYAAVYDESALYYYCDGNLVGMRDDISSVSNGSASAKRMYMLLSLAVYPENDGWIGQRTFTDADFPIKLNVDWVRAYK